MFRMIRLAESPQEGVKHRAKSRSDPLGYALSPRVNTTVSTFATLSALRTLSTRAAVASSPSEGQVAISPAPIRIDAPVSATTSAGASAGAGVGRTGGRE